MGASIDWQIENSAGVETVLHARIGAITQRTTAGSERGAITFYTKGDAGPPTLKMTIDSSGTLYGTSLNTRATNTFFGFEAGKNYVGTGNVFIGYRAGYKETGSKKLYIANDSTSIGRFTTRDGVLIFGDFDNNYVNIYNKLAIGVAKSPAYNLDVAGTGFFSDDLTLDDNMAFVGAGQISTTGNGTMTLDVGTGVVRITGDLTFNLVHGYFYYTDKTEAINLTQNVYSKLTNGTTNLWTTGNASGITFAGDTATIVTPGDYVVFFNVVSAGAGTNDIYKYILCKNGVKVGGAPTAKSTKADGGWTWYLDDLVAGDDISIRVTNTVDNDDITLNDASLYIRKEHD